jgi:carboxymethylenebutenolidase
MMGHWMDLQTALGPITGWRAAPAGRPPGAVVVIQEIFGVNDHIRQVADRLAQAGYVALAPAYFDPIQRDVALAYDEAGVATGRQLIAQLGLEAAQAITASAADSLACEGKVGSLGFCWGGTVALLAALRLGLPSVSYYGARNLPFLEETPKAALMFHFGEHDASIPAEMVQQHREKLPQMALFTYPAGHGFNCDARPDHDPASAALAWSRTLDFFAGQLA